jgi:hypothetical protein
MRKIFLGVAGALLFFAAGLLAKDHVVPALMRLSGMPTDDRIAVGDPDPMRVKMLGVMRDFQEALTEIVSALSKDDGAAAAKLAGRLGMDPPDATAEMRQAMMRRIPEGMHVLGMTMHEQAGKFAQEAAKVKPGGDPRPALAELAQVMQACNACHAAYRLH